jgi:predicted transcriptional regulator
MSLKKLTIHFKNTDDLFKDIIEAIESNKSLVDSTESISFDSIQTYRSFMTSNKSNILNAVSKLRPDSIYELAKFLDRKPQHVLADCRSLESHGFINLKKKELGRKQLRPELIFDYDVIFVDDKGSVPFAVSEKSERVLAKAMLL